MQEPRVATPAATTQQGEPSVAGNGRRLLVLARERRLLEAGEPAEAEPMLLSLLTAAEAAGDHTSASLAESSLGRARGMAGDAAGARQWFDKAEARARAHQLVRPLGWTFLLRGNDAYVVGDQENARIAWQQALAQFEAWGYSKGPDGRTDTADDIELGLIDVRWTMEEYAATYDDDDIKFVGTLDERTGRFTPNIDGPNPARSGSRNNIGDVWVVARYDAETTGGKPASNFRARAHLLVTVPLYMRFDPSAGPPEPPRRPGTGQQ